MSVRFVTEASLRRHVIRWAVRGEYSSNPPERRLEKLGVQGHFEAGSEVRVRRLLVFTTARVKAHALRLIVVVMLPLLGSFAAAQGQGQGGDPSKGVLGPVNALGQEFKLPPPPTGPAPRLPDGTIDLGDGIWITTQFTAASGLKPGEELPLLPAAKALLASRKPTEDPNAWCLPMGVMRYNPYPYRIIQNYTHKRPTHLFIMYELMRTYRQVFMDGRKHPPELEPTWFGHSIGWYEGDTLVIDTVGFNDKAWFDGRGTPHTDQLHTVERWTRVDMGRINTEVLIDDPGAYSQPFTVKYQSTLRPATDDLMEYVCQENNQFGFASGVR